MKVSNLQPFEIVYSFVEHPFLGLLIEPHAVQINSLGNYTLTHQKVFPSTLDYFQQRTDETDEKLIKLLNEIDQEQMVKKFYHKPDAIRPSEFFKKHYNEKLHKEEARPYIDKILNEAIGYIRDKKLFIEGKEKNPTSRALQVAEEKCKVLFHFRREDNRVRYFPTFKYKGDKIDFTGKGARLITQQPSWILLNNTIYNFEKNVEGNKLLPFLEKRFIEIPKSSENTYYEKFVVPLVEKYDIYAVGFDINTEMMLASPLLKVEKESEDTASIGLYFKYGNKYFPYETDKKISVVLDNKNGKYTFTRLRRSQDWEEKQKEFLTGKGLIWQKDHYFSVKNDSQDYFSCVDWLIGHYNELKEKNFDIEGTEKYFTGSRSIEIRVSDQSDWFDIKAIVRFGNYEIPFEKLKPYILRGSRNYELPDGKIAILPEEIFTQYLEFFENSLQGERLRLPKHQWKLLKEKLMPEQLPDLSRYEYAEKNVTETLPEHFNGELRNYQREAFIWLYYLKKNNFGGCLADDMGLGKTVVTSALLLKEQEIFPTQSHGNENMPHPAVPEFNGFPDASQLSLFGHAEKNFVSVSSIASEEITARQTSLVVMPTSLIHNWVGELQRFAPSLKILIHSGIHRPKGISSFRFFDVVISTYGVVRIDMEILKEFRFNYVILDESQFIKNPASLTARAISELKANHKLVLTGTPIENSITDLWSQMNFVNPGLLGSLTSFQRRYVAPIEKYNNEAVRAQLQRIIDPYVLRRTKEEVAKELPQKIEQIYYCTMTEEQEKIYEETKSFYRNSILRSVAEVGLKKSKLHILKGLMMLRQIANHPSIIKKDFLGESGKFNEINRKLKTALEEQHKVLIFSQFVSQLHLFTEHFKAEKIPFFYIDGSLNSAERAQQVELFKKQEGACVFLISLRAGGVGLNLTEADYVFIVDPWWNPAVEQQALDRAHRIGQSQTVFTYKFITKNTVEEKILLLQQRKRAVASALIVENKNFLAEIDEEEIEEIFK